MSKLKMRPMFQDTTASATPSPKAAQNPASPLKTYRRLKSAPEAATLNKMELTAITAVVAYVAHTQNASETTVVSILTSQFGVTKVDTLPSQKYDEAIRFLVDLKLDEVIN